MLRMSSVSFAMANLPPELVDEIIDHVHDDCLALAACALTAPSWTHRARSHLFHTVALRHERSFRHFKTLLEHSPTIAQYPRNLFIDESWNGFEFRNCRNGSSERPWVADALEVLGTRLAGVRSLRVMLHPHLLTDRFNIRMLLNQHFTRVTELFLSDCAFTASDHLLACIEARPGLRRLSLSHVYPTGPMDGALRLPHLEQFEVDYKSCSRTVLVWLLREPDNLRGLRVLQLNNACGDVELITRFLSRVGPSLQHLRLQVGYEWNKLCGKRATVTHNNNPALISLLHIDHLSLSGCTQLQSVTVDILAAEPGGLDLRQLVETIRAPALRQVIIKLSFLHAGAKIGNLDWRLLSPALAHPEFAVLEEVRVVTTRRLSYLGERSTAAYLKKVTKDTAVSRLLRVSKDFAQ